MQSSCVTAQNASLTMISGGDEAMYTLSLALRMLFTLEKTSSGIKSGLYGGRNTRRAPTPVTMSCTRSRWWMLALSIITTERGLRPSKGSKIGSTHWHMNFSPSTVLDVVNVSSIPRVVNTGIADTRFPLMRSTCVCVQPFLEVNIHNCEYYFSCQNQFHESIPACQD